MPIAPRKKLLLRIAAVACAIAILGLILARALPEAALDRQMRAIREAGLPTSRAELAQWFTSVPTNENAALLVTDAISEHVSAPDSVSFATLPLAGGGKLDPQLASDIAEHLEDNRATLQKLHSAASLTESVFPDVFRSPEKALPQLAKIKALSILLRYEAAFYSAQSNRAAAVQSVSSGFALAHALRHESTLIAQLVRIACHAIAIDSLEKLISAHPLTDAQLQALSRRLAEGEADGALGVYRAIIGERATFIEQMIDGHLDPAKLGGPNTAPILSQVSSAISRLFGLHQRDVSLYLESTSRLAAAVTNGFPPAVHMSKKVMAEMDPKLNTGIGRFTGITKLLLPSYQKAIMKVAAVNTQTRCAHTALAVERYRLRHGHLPENLTQLVPEFLDAPPVDPVQGNPLQYTRRPEGGFYISSPGAAAELKNPRQTMFGIYRI